MLFSLAKSALKLAIQVKHTIFYLVNAVIHAMVNKNRQKKKKNFRNYGKSNKKLNVPIEKKYQKFVKNKKRRKSEKEPQHFQELQIYDHESKKNVFS